MPVTHIENIANLRDHVGRDVAVSDWLEVSQERINQFAESIDDRQWIHVDAERAARESPFKETIAHGFLTLSLLSALGKRAMSVGGVRMGINYGLDRVIKAGLNNSAQSDLANALDFEAINQDACFHSPDFIEGVSAFLEKRKAVFGKVA